MGNPTILTTQVRPCYPSLLGEAKGISIGSRISLEIALEEIESMSASSYALYAIKGAIESLRQIEGLGE